MADDVNATIKAFLANIDTMKAKLSEMEAENERLEAELEKTQQNRDSILREKRELEGRKPKPQLRGNDTELYLSQSDARDPARYREMRDLAEKQGKRLRIVEDSAANDGPPQASPVRYVGDQEAGTLYINSAIRDRVGTMRVQEIAREKGFKEARTFRSTRDLPDHLQQAHQQALVDREPGSLIEGDG